MGKANRTILMMLVSGLALLQIPAWAHPAAQAANAESPAIAASAGEPEEEEARAQEQADRQQEKLDRQQEQLDREQEERDREQEKRDRGQERLDRASHLYERGMEALDESRYEKALEAFNQLIATFPGGTRADGAEYWKAYSLNKLGRRKEALSALEELHKTFPTSRWSKDAQALGVEISAASGAPVSPEDQSNEDLKLMALNGLMNSDPERALPMVQKLLESSQSLRVKERAMFVLAQNGSPKAREILVQTARGQSNPDLQLKAIQYLALFGGKESHQTLGDIYASSNDLDVKRAILRSFMMAGERDRLLAAARGEKNPDLRREAIQQLGLVGAEAELWQLYQAEPQVEVKEDILHSLFVGGKSEKLLDVARSEKDPRLRRAAIQSLGLMGADHTGDALVSLYKTEKDAEVRRAILNGFFIQNNGKALVEIARAEKDPAMRRAAIEKLSLIHSKDATDYMLELLNK